MEDVGNKDELITKKRLQKGFERRAKRWRERLLTPEKKLYANGILQADSATLPDFIIIGAQKGGTTWLHHNLAFHPGIFFPDMVGRSDPTEVRYFDQYFYKPLSFYMGLYRKARQMVKGDKSPNYYMLPKERIHFMKQVMPDVRLIFMLRNPVDRAWSQAIMNLVTLSQRPYTEVTPENFYKHFDRTYEKGCYTTTLDNWQTIFAQEQILVLFFEELLEMPQELLQKVAGFINVDTRVDWSSFPFNKKVNKGPSLPLPEAYRSYLYEMYTDEIAALAERFGAPVRRWLPQ